MINISSIDYYLKIQISRHHRDCDKCKVQFPKNLSYVRYSINLRYSRMIYDVDNNTASVKQTPQNEIVVQYFTFHVNISLFSHYSCEFVVGNEIIHIFSMDKYFKIQISYHHNYRDSHRLCYRMVITIVIINHVLSISSIFVVANIISIIMYRLPRHHQDHRN